MLAPIALQLTMRFRCTRAPVGVTVHSLRRPDLRARITHYDGLIVDERILTRAFPALVGPDRMQVLAIARGTVRFEEPIRATLGPGQVWLMPRRTTSHARFENTSFLEVDWPSHEPVPVMPLPESGALLALADELASLSPDGAAQRDYLERLLAALRASSVPIPAELSLGAETLSERDQRLGRALALQLENLKHEGTSTDLAEDAGLSPRQLQRTVADFNARYGINAANWRDTRNRWRVQCAAVLLSEPRLSIADIADEVGFSDATALARAFSQAQFPSPREMRARLFEGKG